MKKIIFMLFLFVFIVACEAGKFTPQRNRLHNMGREDTCSRNPSLCIEGTNIPW